MWVTVFSYTSGNSYMDSIDISVESSCGQGSSWLILQLEAHIASNRFIENCCSCWRCSRNKAPDHDDIILFHKPHRSYKKLLELRLCRCSYDGSCTRCRNNAKVYCEILTYKSKTIPVPLRNQMWKVKTLWSATTTILTKNILISMDVSWAQDLYVT